MQKITSKQDIISSKNFENAVGALSGNVFGLEERYVALYDQHIKNFSESEGYFFSSSGRIEVIGNHTDHNHGKVMCAAVTCDTLAFVTPCNDDTIVVASEGFDTLSVDINDTEIKLAEKGTSDALVRGIISYYKSHGYNIGGFVASTVSSVPKAAGVSSSAAFELLIAEVLNVLYNNGAISKVQKAQASQYAENVYFMKPCGLLDQSAISLGGVSMIDFLDTDNPYILNVEWPFNTVDIIITNTGGNHADLTNHYASIRKDMESVAELFGKTNLRDVDYNEFIKSLPIIQNKVSGRAIIRAIHFFDENNRVDRALSCVQLNNLSGFMSAINESGNSSFEYLQNCYVLGDLAERIPFALAVSSRIKGTLATRIHGGGFAGTIIAYVDKAESATYIEKMQEIFGKESVFRMGIRKEGACYVQL